MSSIPDFAQFETLSFDCYGTLIDWESGILSALRPLLARHGIDSGGAEILQQYARIEPRIQGAAYQPYRQILRGVVKALGEALGFAASETEQRSLENALPGWPPFPDTVAALRALKQRYKLAVLSNVDDDLFAGTARQLGVSFDHVVTAQQVGAYKPSLKNFRTLLARVALPAERVLHVAQSRYHDIAPARESGLATVWVERRSAHRAHGATPEAEAPADVIVPDLRSLVALIVERER